MRKITWLAAAAIVAGFGGAAQAQQTLRIATDATYPPFESADAAGNIVGFDIDIGKALCDEMKVSCEFVNQNWDGIIPGLLANNYDMILSSMSITPERMEQIDFTDKYYNTPPAVAVPKDSDIQGITPADLAGKVIGAQVSTTHAAYSEQTYTDAEVRLYPTADEYKLDLASGRIDAAVDDIIVLSSWLASPEGACCRLAGTITPVESIHGKGAGIGIRKGEDDLKAKLNAAIKTIRENGTYKAINDKYFAFDVYGG